MTKARILGVGLIIMILLNLAMLFFGFLKKPPHHLKEGPKQMVIERLNLDAAQQASYLELIDEHKQAVRQKEEQVQFKRAELFSLLSKDERENASKIQKEIGQLITEIEKIHFKHFESIEAICRVDQKARFKELSSELEKFFRHSRPRPKP